MNKEFFVTPTPEELDRLSCETTAQIDAHDLMLHPIRVQKLIRSVLDQALAMQRGGILEEAAKVCEDYFAKKWAGYKTVNGPERADPHVQGESCGADDCATAIRALKG